MKYLSLLLAIIRGLIIIGVVIWLLFEIRENLVYGKAVLSQRFFITLLEASLGIAFSLAAKSCLRQIKKFNESNKEKKDLIKW